MASGMKAAFISIEGIEGCGKTTQTRMVSEYLEGKGISCIQVREPGGTPIGEKIRDILLDPKNSMNVLTEALLYFAARAQLVEEVIKPALKEGKWVVADRFSDSTLAYQGHAGGLGIEELGKLSNLIDPNQIVPDLTLVLDLDIKEGLSRLEGVLDRIEIRELEFHNKVREAFKLLSKRSPEKIKLIDAEGKPEETFSKIKVHLDELIKRAKSEV